MPDEQSRTGAGGAFGLLINKRSLRRLEIPVRHEIRAEAGGWRLDVRDAGKITAYYASPPDQDSIDLEPGDYLLAAGEDVYVCVQRLKVRDRPSREDEDGDEDKDRDEDDDRPKNTKSPRKAS